MSIDNGKPVNWSEKVEKSFNGVSNLRPVYIESNGQGVGGSSNTDSGQGGQTIQNTPTTAKE
jgi:hypothetical protein